MKRILYFVVFAVLTSPLHAQENNCEFGAEAQKRIDKAMKLYQTAKNEDELLEAATEFEWALQNNPKCEDIYFTLAAIYTEAGQGRAHEILYARTYSELEYIEQHSTQYFIMAKARLNDLMRFNKDSDIALEVQNLLNDIAYKESELNKNTELIERKFALEIAAIEEEQNAKIAENRLKKLKDEEKDYSGFLSLGVGYGKSYGEMGAKVSIYTAPNGFVFTGGIGYPADYYFKDNKTLPLLWAAGVGYSMGSYKYNFQLLVLYGKIQTQENFYENTGGITIASNIKLFSNFALNLDVGYWLSDTSEIAAVFGFSAGLCYKFSF